MNTRDFERKLQQLNPDLFIDFDHIHYRTNPRGSSGIYLANTKEDQVESHNDLSLNDRNIIRKFNERNCSYVAWTTHPYITQCDEFNENCKPITMGWRSILRRLVNKRIVSKEKAEKVFGWYESDYDRMSFNEKLDFYRSMNDHTDNGIYS